MYHYINWYDINTNANSSYLYVALLPENVS